MTDHTDVVVWRAFERSAIARAIERVAAVIGRAGGHSRAVASGRSWVSAAATQPGHLLLAAAVTHFVLMVAIARPASWQWLILPSIGALAGMVLIAFSRRARKEP